MKIAKASTHVLAALSGAGLWLAFRPADSPEAAAVNPGGRDLRDDRVDEQIRQRLAEFAENSRESRRLVAEMIRDPGLAAIGIERENRERLAKLRSLADTYRGLPDLNGVLMDALVEEDPDICAAIFLEWHRRSPAEAFEELARRSRWTSSVLGEAAIILALAPEEIVAQLKHPGRSDEFRGSLAYLHSLRLAESDDLAGLTATYDALEGTTRDGFVSNFIEEWVPDDGKKAAAFVTGGMTPELRTAFLKELAKGRDWGHGLLFQEEQLSSPYAAWTDEFAAALLATGLGENEDLRKDFAAQSKRSDGVSVDPVPERKDGDVSIKEGLDARNAGYAIRDCLDRLLFNQLDYPELFSRGGIGAEEIRDALTTQLPGLAAYEEELTAALFQRLAPHDPARATTWAAEQMGKERLAAESLNMLHDVAEPRGARLAFLMNRLPQVVLQPNDTFWARDSITRRFEEWVEMDTEAIARIPANAGWKPEFHPLPEDDEE